MCELMTIATALAFTFWYFAGRKNGNPDRAVFRTMLLFWGAALMWAVDCVAEALAGEPLLDLSREDAVLGAIILAAGLLAFGFFKACEACRCHVARPQA